MVNILTVGTVLWMLAIGISREDRTGKWQVAALRDLTVCLPPTALLLHVASALFLPRCWLPSSLLPPLRARIELCCSSLSSLPLSLSLSSCYICHLFTRTPTAHSFISHAPPLAPRSLSTWDSYYLLCGSLIQRSLLVADVLHCRECAFCPSTLWGWPSLKVVSSCHLIQCRPYTELNKYLDSSSKLFDVLALCSHY